MITDFALVKSEIASFLGTTESHWDNRTAIDIESSIRKGIDTVIHNPMSHQWSWMRPIYRFQTADGQRNYTLPLDFEQFIENVIFDGDEYRHTPITQLPVGRLQQLHGEYNSTGVPTNYAIEVAAHDGATQQTQQVALQPTPDGEYSLIGRYQVGPIRSLSTERPWFPGGPENRELFIASCLAATESKFFDGPGTDKMELFQTVLMAAIQRDHRKQPRNLGQMGGSQGRNSYRYKLETTYLGGTDV